MHQLYGRVEVMKRINNVTILLLELNEITLIKDSLCLIICIIDYRYSTV